MKRFGRKKLALFFIVIFCAVLTPLYSLAEKPEGEEEEGEDLDVEIERQLGFYDFSSWNDLFSDVNSGENAVSRGIDFNNLISGLTQGKSPLDSENIFETIGNATVKVIKENLSLMTIIIGIALISGVISETLPDENKELKTIVSFICYGLTISIMLREFGIIVSGTRNVIEQISGFEEIAMPVLTTMLSAVGSINAGTVYQPLMGLLSGSIILVINTVVLPIILVGGILGIIDSITERVQLKQMFSLCKTAVKWVLGVITTVYFGLTAIQGITASTFDSVSIRTAKFAVERLVPIIGNMVSGTMDTVLGCGIIIKNATGVTAIVIVLSLVYTQLISIIGIMFTYRITAAICEPIADKRFTNMLVSIADISTYLFSAVIAILVMFIITIGLIIATGNNFITG